jgi:UDP-N-acetylmuramate--alanine ligase
MDLPRGWCGFIVGFVAVCLMTHVHLIGIGGSGISAIARVLIERGYIVSGSDQELSPLAIEIQAMGAKVCLGHQAENVVGADWVVRSSAIPDDNVEVEHALDVGIPVFKRADFLGKLIEDRFGIAIAGTHGKTTTTAMISWVLTAMGQDPSYIIGGISKNLANNAHAGKGNAFVIEADEYDHMFLGLHPEIAIVTSVEHDHPDCFPTAEDFFQAFVQFAHQLPEDGLLLTCTDDTGAKKLHEIATKDGIRALSYGLDLIEDWISPLFSGSNLEVDKMGNFHFDAHYEERYLARVSLGVPGLHNVRNALAALAVVCELNLPVEQAAQALGEYLGTGRRFETRGEFAGITIIDDYAHHPTEIRATLAAARNRYPDRQLWAVWQPHTYSRTRVFYQDFLTAFGEADHVLVTEIYASREPLNSDFSSQELVKAMKHPDVRFVEGNLQASDYLLSHLQEGDVLMVLSAGDGDQISQNIVESLSQNGNDQNDHL